MKTLDIKERGIQWLEKQGWKNIEPSIANFILLQNQLDEYPYKPHALIEKDKQQFFVNFFNKEDYFFSKNKRRNLEQYVTGFEWYKYKLGEMLEAITNIPIAVVFHNELTDEFIFRQLNQLSPPIRWRSSYCLSKQYKRHDEEFKCYQCWKNNPYTAKNCIKRKTKTRPMAVWPVQNFLEDTSYQSQLFTKKYDIPRKYRKSN